MVSSKWRRGDRTTSATSAHQQDNHNCGCALDTVHHPEYIKGVLHRVALVQQPGLWQRLYHYPEDQSINILLCGYHLFYLVPGELGAGYAPGTQWQGTFLALVYSAPAAADIQVERYPGNSTAQPDIWSGG